MTGSDRRVSHDYFDLVVHGGLVVTAGARFVGDVGIRNGVVACLGYDLHGASVIDAQGLLVLPGGVDLHLHLTPAYVGEEEYPWVDDFETGSKAAAAGGVTTIGNMTFTRPQERPVDAIMRTVSMATDRSILDFILHPVLAEPSTLSDTSIGELADLGCKTIKLFTNMLRDAGDSSILMNTLSAAAAHELLPMVHCEDPSPDAAAIEGTAVARTVAIARSLSAQVYLVHVATADALHHIRRAREEGARVWVETRPEYLLLSAERLKGEAALLAAMTPALPSLDDIEALWTAIGDGSVQTWGSDHAPWMRRQKLTSARELGRPLSGVASVETMLPLLFSEGVIGKRISVETFVALSATNPAKAIGAYPRKGTIALGSDADLTLWDPDASGQVDASCWQSRADYSILQGRPIAAQPAYVFQRGRLLYERSAGVTAVRGGQWLGDMPSRATAELLQLSNPLSDVPSGAVRQSGTYKYPT